LREGWGDSIAFLYGWQSILIMDPGVTAALAVGLAQYVGVLWPAAAGHDRWVAVAGIWLLAAFSMTGFTLSARTLATITAMKVLAFAAVVAAAFASPAGRWEHFEPFVDRAVSSVPLGQALAIGLVSAFFSFGGFWEASRVAGDVEDAPRVLRRALAIGIATVAVIYVAMTCAFIYVVPVRDVTSAADFARLAGEAMFGARGAAILAAIVVLSVLSSALALLIMAPRLYIAMSRDDVFPSRLAAVDSRTGVPARAVALLATLASVFAAIGDFRQIVAFFMCTTLAFVGLAAAALPVVRRRSPHAHGANASLVTTGMFVLLIAVVLALVTINQPFQALAGLVIVLLGIPARALRTRWIAS
jgi:APA family basic amino acid/polyamine antiporter